jgi:zinc/manganese transport system substrate-binding protein
MKHSTSLLASPVSALFALASCVGPAPTDSNGGTQSPTATSSETTPATGALSVVASTSVWASIVEFVGGDAVEVTAIILDPNRDPHSYEASVRDQLAVSEADLVVMNGGGYDDFLLQLAAAAPEAKLILSAVEGEDSYEEGEHSNSENEHVWYDFDVVSEFAVRLADVLTELRPDALQAISSNFDEFEAEMEVLSLRRDALRDRALGLGVMQTAPLASLLLEDAGFTDLTPPDLLEAIEEEREVPPLVMGEAQSLLESGDIALLAVNEQLVDPQSEQLIEWGQSSGVAIVYLGELIPDPATQDYLDWMHAILDDLQEKIYG